MTNQEPWKLTIAQLSGLYRKHQLSPVEVTEMILQRIVSMEPRLNAFFLVTSERALEDARKAEAQVLRSELVSPLCGIPISIKDNVEVAHFPLTCGSNVLRSWYVSSDDAYVVNRLHNAGAVLLGKNSMMEFACGDAYPEQTITHNPWNLERSTGGSSSGSAATVAARQAFAAIGTDTGGSIRNPASYCGLTGLKPTYGLVSRSGVVPTAWSCDHVGVLARTAVDVATVMLVIADHDPDDPGSADFPLPHFSSVSENPMEGIRVGVVLREFEVDVEPQVRDASLRAVDVLRALGMQVIEVELPPFEDVVNAWSITFLSEAAAYHRKWLREHPEGYSTRLRARLAVGSLIPAADYMHAQRFRRDFFERVNGVFVHVDALVTPTTPTPAQSFEDRGRTDLRAYVRKTSPFNFTGHPAVSIPCGFASDGLPIGLQIIGRISEDDTVLGIAHAYQTATDWHDIWPPKPEYE